MNYEHHVQRSNPAGTKKTAIYCRCNLPLLQGHGSTSSRHGDRRAVLHWMRI